MRGCRLWNCSTMARSFSGEPLSITTISSAPCAYRVCSTRSCRHPCMNASDRYVETSAVTSGFFMVIPGSHRRGRHGALASLDLGGGDPRRGAHRPVAGGHRRGEPRFLLLKVVAEE